MRQLKTIGLFGLLTVLSCADKPTSSTNDKEEATDGSSYRIVVHDDKIVVNDDYAVQPLNIDNFTMDFQDFEIKKEPLKNHYGGEQIDTIITLTKQADTLYIYKTPSKQFLYAMRVNSERIQLDRNIRLGMSKKEFYKAFKQLDTVTNKKDFVRIWSLESSVEFEFKADTLSKITWDFGSVE